MKLITGLLIGIAGAAVWMLSEPEAGEEADLSGRVARLKIEWERAVEQGKAAGEARQRQMQQEFEAIFQK